MEAAYKARDDAISSYLAQMSTKLGMGPPPSFQTDLSMLALDDEEDGEGAHDNSFIPPPDHHSYPGSGLNPPPPSPPPPSGKTQLINHFLVNKSWYLVDLPGYGYALQVAKFFEFVKKKKEDSALEVDENALKGNQQQVLLPHKGLWVPEGKDLPESVRSLDFRTMSLSH